MSVRLGLPGGVKCAFDDPGELHPPGERHIANVGVIANDAGDGVGPEIENDRQPGMVRWHTGNHAANDAAPSASAASGNSH